MKSILFLAAIAPILANALPPTFNGKCGKVNIRMNSNPKQSSNQGPGCRNYMPGLLLGQLLRSRQHLRLDRCTMWYWMSVSLRYLQACLVFQQFGILQQIQQLV